LEGSKNIADKLWWEEIDGKKRNRERSALRIPFAGSWRRVLRLNQKI
jgi:hypothetical protein